VNLGAARLGTAPLLTKSEKAAGPVLSDLDIGGLFEVLNLLGLPAGLSAPASAGIGVPAAVAAAAPARCFGTRFIYVERSAVQFGAVQLRNGRLGCIRIRHFDEGEAAGLARVTIGHDTDALHTAESGESSLKVVLSSLITEISDKYVGHSIDPLFCIYLCRTALEPNFGKAEVAIGRHSKGDTDAGKDITSLSETLGRCANVFEK